MNRSGLFLMEWDKFRKLDLFTYSIYLYSGYLAVILLLTQMNTADQEMNYFLAMGSFKLAIFLVQVIVQPIYFYTLYLFHQMEVQASSVERYKLKKIPYLAVYFYKFCIGWIVSISLLFLTISVLFFSQGLYEFLPLSFLVNNLLALCLGQLIQIIFILSLYQFLKTNYLVIAVLILFSLLTNFDLPYNAFYFVSRAINMYTYQGAVDLTPYYYKVLGLGSIIFLVSIILIRIKIKFIKNDIAF